MSTAKFPISVHILTFNSAASVERALASVADWCAEILIVDGGSTDDTLNIAKRYGARIIPQRELAEQGKPIRDFAAVRNRALAEATEAWILALDSDETISDALKQEIQDAVQEGVPAAFLIPRIYVLPDGRIVDHAATYPNARIYFFHKQCIEQWVKPVHERPALKPRAPVKTFKGASLGPLSTVAEFKRRCCEVYLPIEHEESKGRGWAHWLQHRVWHTVRSRIILTVKLLGIWLVPKRGIRMSLRYELLRYWYGWQLIKVTCPLNRKLRM